MKSCILQYRNGIYQGQVKGKKRHGEGILITDNNTIIVSEWKNDVMSGKGLVFYSPDQYGYGQFNRGEIEGPFLFRTKNKTLFSEFNLSRPIGKMVLINHESQKVQTIIHKTPIFEVLSERSLSNNQDEEHQIENAIGVKFPCHTLLDFLYKQVCKQGTKTFYEQLKMQDTPQENANQSNFRIKNLNNGHIFFFFEDQASPSCLGFCLNKNEQLVSCGMYANQKLSGLGCKFENTIRYEGVFENGFVHGIGLKYGQGKFSFGQFQNGNLIEALYIDDRGPMSEQKLTEFKKLEHIRSIWYENSYIRPNIVKFKGIKELVFEYDAQQQFMYPIANHILSLAQRSPVKGVSLNQTANSLFNDSPLKRTSNLNLSNGGSNSKNQARGTLNKKEDYSKQYKPILLDRSGKNSFDVDEANNEELANSKTKIDVSANNKSIKESLAKVTQLLNTKGYMKNPEDEDKVGEGARQSNALKNLRKFKY